MCRGLLRVWKVVWLAVVVVVVVVLVVLALVVRPLLRGSLARTIVVAGRGREKLVAGRWFRSEEVLRLSLNLRKSEPL